MPPRNSVNGPSPTHEHIPAPTIGLISPPELTIRKRIIAQQKKNVKQNSDQLTNLN